MDCFVDRVNGEDDGGLYDASARKIRNTYHSWRALTHAMGILSDLLVLVLVIIIVLFAITLFIHLLPFLILVVLVLLVLWVLFFRNRS